MQISLLLNILQFNLLIPSLCVGGGGRNELKTLQPQGKTFFFKKKKKAELRGMVPLHVTNNSFSHFGN